MSMRSKLARLGVAGGIVVGSLVPASAAFGVYGDGNPGGGGGGSDTGSGEPGRDGGNLPITGGDALGLAAIGLVVLGGGTALTRATRRRAVSA